MPTARLLSSISTATVQNGPLTSNSTTFKVSRPQLCSDYIFRSQTKRLFVLERVWWLWIWSVDRCNNWSNASNSGKIKPKWTWNRRNNEVTVGETRKIQSRAYQGFNQNFHLLWSSSRLSFKGPGNTELYLKTSRRPCSYHHPCVQVKPLSTFQAKLVESSSDQSLS